MQSVFIRTSLFGFTLYQIDNDKGICVNNLPFDIEISVRPMITRHEE